MVPTTVQAARCFGDRAAGVVPRRSHAAWNWRRRLEAGEVATLQDIADAEKVTLPFISRFIRLAYLSPIVAERIVSERGRIAVSLDDLAAATLEPWARQPARILDRPGRL